MLLTRAFTRVRVRLVASASPMSKLSRALGADKLCEFHVWPKTRPPWLIHSGTALARCVASRVVCPSRLTASRGSQGLAGAVALALRACLAVRHIDALAVPVFLQRAVAMAATCAR